MWNNTTFVLRKSSEYRDGHIRFFRLLRFFILHKVSMNTSYKSVFIFAPTCHPDEKSNFLGSESSLTDLKVACKGCKTTWTWFLLQLHVHPFSIKSPSLYAKAEEYLSHTITAFSIFYIAPCVEGSEMCPTFNHWNHQVLKIRPLVEYNHFAITVTTALKSGVRRQQAHLQSVTSLWIARTFVFDPLCLQTDNP